MCEHCGCKSVPAIGELMAEHVALHDEAHRVRAALRVGDRNGALARLDRLVGHLERHVGREEAGIFRALRDQGEFADEVSRLEGEHRTLDAAIAAIHLDAPGVENLVTRLLDDLAEHIEREDLGVFPVSVVTLGAAGWDLVEQAHQQSPTFLRDPVGVSPVLAP